ncbi:nitrate- and nitrite sensing domain-containing protein [Nocardia sp. CDC159]|uniref:histidine kinase n=1 Tax=Nocardia pulmonis TaxID=2951408 RepID=A0A9X2IWS1_9NOCA|nr:MULTISPECIES: nitrate- and nitrite sensing domain-containing protein [Nocardia]MCM6775237.1 nitrate- and nitrite sensing domain-containing protein [Nocardia pulmonis]MCM6788029.1 nitrate- and nitrite sensing domain-containing protein [Nocardia sp. CDC159]
MLRARLGIRARILAIALVPSLALLVIGVGAAGYLVREGQHARHWASILEGANKHTRELIASVEQERLQSLWALSGEPDPVALGAARQRLDNALRDMQSIESAILESDAEKMGPDLGGFDTLKKQLPQLRGAVDAGVLPVPDTYGAYTAILTGVELGTDITARTAPDAAVANELGHSLRQLRAMDANSRVAALTAAALSPAGLPAPLQAEYRNLVGYYRTELPLLVKDIGGEQGQRIQAVIDSSAWQQLATMEDFIIHPPAKPSTSNGTGTGTGTTGTSGTATNTAPPQPPIGIPEWRAASDQFNRQMLEVWQAQNDHANHTAVVDGDRTARNALLAGAGILALSVLAFVLSLWLANRLIGRLKRLRTETLALAEVRLPDTMRRLGEGEDIDPETEAAHLDFGHDEIGSVAKAFNQAHTAAVAAAVTEARTREGVRAVFLNIAHRSQMVVHRQLEILDEAEQKQEDPALLETFFKLDHLATRERRNAENLIILGGGQPGRQWRRPVPLVELVRSSVGETLDYARVRTARMPQVFVVGSVVADLIHLLAELVDNATTFSPPQSRVEVTGNIVGKGVVVEISDQGMGMPAADLERANELLRDPPDFGVATLSADSRLGLFVVAQLGVKHGISVRLSESDYGGIRAIVLIPSALITNDAPLADHLPERTPARRPEPPATGQIPAVPVPQSLPAPTALATLPPREPEPEPEPPQPQPEPPRYIPEPRNPEPRHRATEQRPSYTGNDSRPPLPRRRRQASLAPELATDQQAAAQDTPQRPRSAEQARDLMSAIENGTRQGRRAHPDPHTANNPDEQEGEGDLFQRR